MNRTRHREVGDYLRRLQRSMVDLPAERREEILAEIEEHIAEDLAENPAPTDADVRNVLERVGHPEDIAAEARERFEISPVTPSQRRTASWTDIAAVSLLVLGSLMITPIYPIYRPEVMVVAWSAALVLLWISDVWRTRDKVGVTLVLSAAAFCAVAIEGAGDEGFVYFAIILFASIWAPVRLGLGLRRARLAGGSENVLVRAPGGTEERGRATWLIGGLLALAVVGATVIALFPLADGGEESTTHRDVPLITEAQFDRVALGDSKDQVLQSLGGPGDAGSLVSGLDPLAREVPQDVGETQFDDCWSYQLTDSGVGPGSDAGVCFDSSDEVIYTRLRIA